MKNPVALFIVIMGLVLSPFNGAFALECVHTSFLRFQVHPDHLAIRCVIVKSTEVGLLEVEVKEVLFGKLPVKNIEVSAESLVYWSFGKIAFPEKSEWVIDIWQRPNDGKSPTYKISPCTSPLKLIHDVAEGGITDPFKVEKLPYDELRKTFLEKFRASGIAESSCCAQPDVAAEAPQAPR